MLSIFFALAVRQATVPQAIAPAGAEPHKPEAKAWVTQDDYPAAAQRGEASGYVEYVLDVTPEGLVGGCRIVLTSGFSILDEATCSVLTRRARFHPGHDDSGHPTGGIFRGNFKCISAEPPSS